MASKDVDKTVDHTATVHGYWMGGKDHFTASWEAAEELLRARPPTGPGALAGERLAGEAGHQGPDVTAQLTNSFARPRTRP